MKSLFRLLLLAGLATLAAYACAFQVMEGESVILARFGDPRRTINEPGLYFKWPPPVESVVRVDQRVHVLDPGPAEYLTSDKKNVTVQSFLAWRVVDPRRFHVSVGTRGGAEVRLAEMLRSVLGEVISAFPFSALVSTEDAAMHDVMGTLTESAARKIDDAFGVQVVTVRVKRLNFPVQNKTAVFRRMEAEREATAATFRSEGVEQYEKIKADTDRAEAEMLAEASRKAAEIRGDADAESARIYADTIAKDPELWRFLRSLEVLGEVMGDGSTLILGDDHPLFEVLNGPKTEDDGD